MPTTRPTTRRQGSRGGRIGGRRCWSSRSRSTRPATAGYEWMGGSCSGGRHVSSRTWGSRSWSTGPLFYGQTGELETRPLPPGLVHDDVVPPLHRSRGGVEEPDRKPETQDALTDRAPANSLTPAPSPPPSGRAPRGRDCRDGRRRRAGRRGGGPQEAGALVHECARACDPSLEACCDVGSRGPAARALRLETDVARYSCTNALGGALRGQRRAGIEEGAARATPSSVAA